MWYVFGNTPLVKHDEQFDHASLLLFYDSKADIPHPME